MINLSLPLSATALRLGSAFLSDLAAQSEVILSETRGPEPKMWLGETLLTPEVVASASFEVVEPLATTLEQDIETAEAAVITQADVNPTQFETVVTGHERNPDYAGANAAFDQAALEAVGWTIDSLVADGYLIPVTEQRPLAAAAGASNPAPAPAPVPPAPAGSTVVVDKAGQPYDPRIHAKAEVPFTKEGFWKTKKNLPDGYKAQIEAENLKVMAVSSNTATTGSESAPAPAPVAPSAPAAPAPAPAAAAAPAAPSPTPAPAANGAMTFAEFTRYLVANKVDQGKVNLQVQKVGLTSIPDLAKRPDLIPAVVEGLKG